MTVQSWFIYLTLVLVATATPGPAVLFIMTHASLHGWRKALFAALGNIIGLLTLGIIAVTGLGTILKTSEIVFLTALFPQFINIEQALIPQFTLLIATLMCFSFSFLMSYALLAHNAKIWLASPGRIKVVNRTSGAIFIGFGLLLATSTNK